MIRVREVSGSMLTTGLLVYWNDSGARGAECNADKPVHFKFCSSSWEHLHQEIMGYRIITTGLLV